MLQDRPLYLDTETTGRGPTAEVIEIGIVDDDGEVLFTSLVRPRGVIEPGTLRVHHILPDQVAGAPLWADVWPLARRHLVDRRIGVYNSEFDLRLLKQTHQRAWLRWDMDDHQFFCIMKLYARFRGDWDPNRLSYRWHSLENAGQQCQIPLPNSHRAVDDALLARALLHYVAASYA